MRVNLAGVVMVSLGIATSASAGSDARMSNQYVSYAPPSGFTLADTPDVFDGPNGSTLRIQPESYDEDSRLRQYLMDNEEFPGTLQNGSQRIELEKLDAGSVSQPIWIVDETLLIPERVYITRAFRVVCRRRVRVELVSLLDDPNRKGLVTSVASSLQSASPCIRHREPRELDAAIRLARNSGSYFPPGILTPDGREESRVAQLLETLGEPSLFSEGWSEAYRAQLHYFNDIFVIVVGQRPKTQEVRLKHVRCGQLLSEDSFPITLADFASTAATLDTSLSFWERPLPFEVGVPSVSFDETFFSIEGIRGDDYQLLTEVNSLEGTVGALIEWAENLVGREVKLERMPCYDESPIRR